MTMNQVPVFPEPFSVPLEQYGETLAAHSRESHAHAKSLIETMQLTRYIREHLGWIEAIGEQVDVEFLATGSDGRSEKATFIPGRLNGNNMQASEHLHGTEIPSRIDIQAVISLYPAMNAAILRGPLDIDALERSYQNMIMEHRVAIVKIIENDLSPLELFEPEVELKSAHDPFPSGFDNEPSNPWPTRILDATNLSSGDGYLEKLLRIKLLDEMASSVQRSRKLRDIEKGRMRKYRKICTGSESPTGQRLKPGMQYYSAKRDIITNFDLDEGRSNYDRKQGIASFKFGPLRLVQMQTSSAILTNLSKCLITSGIAMLRELPKSTAAKLHFLSHTGEISLPQKTLERLIENYNFFLRQYHQSEWNFAANGSTVLYYAHDEAGRSEVRERLTDITSDAAAVTKQ